MERSFHFQCIFCPCLRDTLPQLWGQVSAQVYLSSNENGSCVLSYWVRVNKRNLVITKYRTIKTVFTIFPRVLWEKHRADLQFSRDVSLLCTNFTLVSFLIFVPHRQSVFQGCKNTGTHRRSKYSLQRLAYIYIGWFLPITAEAHSHCAGFTQFRILPSELSEVSCFSHTNRAILTVYESAQCILEAWFKNYSSYQKMFASVHLFLFRIFSEKFSQLLVKQESHVPAWQEIVTD